MRISPPYACLSFYFPRTTCRSIRIDSLPKPTCSVGSFEALTFITPTEVLNKSANSHPSHNFPGGNPLLGSVWGPQAAGPFSLMHAGYGLGAAVGPLLVAPFTIRPSGTNGTEALDATEDSDHFTALLTNTTEPALIRPAIPYNLVAGILLVSALCFIFFGGVPNRCSMCQSAGGSNHSTAKRSNMVSGEVLTEQLVSQIFALPTFLDTENASSLYTVAIL